MQILTQQTGTVLETQIDEVESSKNWSDNEDHASNAAFVPETQIGVVSITLNESEVDVRRQVKDYGNQKFENVEDLEADDSEVRKTWEIGKQIGLLINQEEELIDALAKSKKITKEETMRRRRRPQKKKSNNRA